MKTIKYKAKTAGPTNSAISDFTPLPLRRKATDAAMHNTENEGTENEGEAPAAITLDGKQWVAVVEEGVSGYCFDFGVTTPGMYIECNISLNPTAPAYYKFTDTTPGDYLIEPETETTGKLTAVNPMWGPAEYLYKDLTETSVMIQDPIYGSPEYLPFTVAEQLIVPQEESQE